MPRAFCRGCSMTFEPVSLLTTRCSSVNYMCKIQYYTVRLEFVIWNTCIVTFTRNSIWVFFFRQIGYSILETHVGDRNFKLLVKKSHQLLEPTYVAVKSRTVREIQSWNSQNSHFLYGLPDWSFMLDRFIWLRGSPVKAPAIKFLVYNIRSHVRPDNDYVT